MQITIHATRKLHSKLPLNPSGFLVPRTPVLQLVPPQLTDNPLSGWHANLLTLQRHNCVILVHDTTRFAVFIKHLLKHDLENLDWHFQDAVMNTLLKLGATGQQLDTAAALLAPCQFDTECSRSVQATMSRMSGDIEHMLWYEQAKLDDINAYRVGVWLADRPCSVKGRKEWLWPKRAILQLLSPPSSE